MTDAQKRKIRANLKHIEVAQWALACVDVDFMVEGSDGDYASELWSKWEAVRYYLDDFSSEFRLKLYEADNPD